MSVPAHLKDGFPELPAQMAQLPKDHRGYPIPWIVMRDRAGQPHFTINDHAKVMQCVDHGLCGICGGFMPKIADRRPHGGMWFVGGPGCFLLPNGAFLDPPNHFACAEYALRVCPYLAAPSYARRIDDRTIKPGMMPDGVAIVADAAALDARPPLFMLGQTQRYMLLERGGSVLFTVAQHDWKLIMGWRYGEPIVIDEAVRTEIRGHLDGIIGGGR